jgi:DNA-binding NtrC family response regulator
MIVDDDDALTTLLHRWLHLEGFAVRSYSDGEGMLEGLSSTLPACLLLDVNLPGIGGMEILEHVKDRHPVLPVILVTGESTVDMAVEAMRLGAYDFLTKPLDRAHLVTTVRNAVERGEMAVRITHLERESRGAGYGEIVGSAPAMQQLFRQMDRVALSDVTVLIRGESGTGKELVARALHEAGSRSAGPFQAVNCAAIPENLQESQLFGHEKGAFTGATERRIGSFEAADGGTLFLDELGDLSPEAQAKLLRAIQERRFTRVGGTKEIRSDFRLMAATHRDLEEMVSDGTFREDLFFRVAVFELTLPPLRERREDVSLLLEHFLERLHPAPPVPRVDRAALAHLLAYEWPGNVRELENAVQRMLVTCGDEIYPDDLPPRVRAGSGGAARSGGAGPAGRGDPGTGSAEPETLNLKELERRTIIRALDVHEGSPTEAAKALGIGRTTLYRKMDEYGLR